MSDVVVLGGGFAGLAAAVTLSDAGVRVTVLEGRTGLGGRARSFVDPATGEVVDNGQHLFLGGYRETLQFLDRLGTRKYLLLQDRLQVSFVEPGGRVSRLDCPALPAPWHLWIGVARLSTLSWKDKLAVRRVARKMADGNRESVEEWLTRLGQSPRSRKAFWYPLAIAALNEDPSVASAAGLVSVLRVLLTGSWRDSRLGMAAVGLSDLYTTAARRIVEEKGGHVRVNSPVAALEMQDSRVTGVRLASGTVLTADAVVSSLPPAALSRILPESAIAGDPALSNLKRFTSSPILSVNLWLDQPVTDALFVGLIGTRFHWLFNKAEILRRAGIEANYVTLILSAAHRFLDQSNEALVATAMEDLRSCFPRVKQAELIRSQVVREREATVSLTADVEPLRPWPGPTENFSNLFLAGDWTATGLPATIESAVASGRTCAQAFLQIK